MLIVCPTCATTYQIAPAALGAGRTVRCAQCKNAWFATPQPEFEEAVAAPAAMGAADDFARASAQDVLPPAPPVPDNPFAVADAPPLVPQDPPEAEGAPKFDPGLPDQGETIAAKRARQTHADRKDRPSLLRRLFSLPVLIIVMLTILLGALNWRAAVVRHFPQTASLYAALGLPVNLRGLFFQDVKSRSELENGAGVLVIEGTIVNLTT
ncbi:MAG TPA: zinc-ribbon domain-containing protein, partial [Gemmatimonadales bacterium]|nr:zinc-ribbon domain-containing protein [Gemmatimonadales bacterium]